MERSEKRMDDTVSPHWSDGVPVIPPTRERVAAMLSQSPLPAGHVLGMVPPAQGEATVEKVAANAVMAGCRPEAFPVVLAATQAVLRDDFNLRAVQSVPHVACLVLVIHGGVAKALGVNAGPNIFGTACESNVVIARALRLVLFNLGWGSGEDGRRRWGRTVYCFAEDEDASPWPPFASAPASASAGGAVTVFAGEAPCCVVNFSGARAVDVLDSVAERLAVCGNASTGTPGEVMAVLSGEHAAIIARDGFDRHGAQRYLFDRGKRPLDFLKASGLYGGRFERYASLVSRGGEIAEQVPPARTPEAIHLLVAGGRAGKFSVVVPGWGYLGSRAVTLPVVSLNHGGRVLNSRGGPSELVNPLAEGSRGLAPEGLPRVARRVRVVGLLDNAKGTADILLDEIGRHVAAELALEARFARKELFSRPAPDQLIATLQRTCDLVITAVGD